MYILRIRGVNIGNMNEMKKWTKRIFIIVVFFIIAVAGINFYIIYTTKRHIKNEFNELENAYTVIVLGAKVYSNGNLSNYLKDRVENAYELYTKGKVKRFLLSGDHGTKEYDEVNAMKNYLNQKGVPNSDIFLDHAGFNTYNSIVRAKEVFEVNSCIIVSQDYHLPRAVYIANKVGLNAQAYASSSNYLTANKFNKKREIIARAKSFFEVLFNIKPKYLGKKHPITGNSATTFD